VASGPAIARAAADAIGAGAALGPAATTALRTADPLNARAVFDAARDGDPLALELTEAAGGVLARAIVGLILTCDLDRVLVGGGVAGAGEIFFHPITAELERLRAMSPLIDELVPVGAVRLLPPQFDAVAWGGVALARRAVGGDLPIDTDIDRRHPAPRVDEEEVVARERLT